MPLCTCGCGQTLARRNIKKHRARKAAPQLVSSAVKAFLQHGATVSPPRLRRSKKLRSSRQYFPSAHSPSPTSDPPLAEPFNNDAEMNIMEDGYAESSETNPDDDNVVEAILRHTEHDVWDGRHYHEDAHEDEGAGEDSRDNGLDDDYDGSASDDDENGDGYHWEDQQRDPEPSRGLSALELLNEEFEREAIARGMLYRTRVPLSLTDSSPASNLSEADISFLRQYSFKVNNHITDAAFAQLPFVFPSEPIPTVDACRSRLQFLSGLKPVKYHCCINSCCCFTGPHANLLACPYCGEARYSSEKKPRKYFNYLPFIPRLVAMYANPDKNKEMRYRAFEHSHSPDNITDVFDSHIYRRLLGTKVHIDGRDFHHEYFCDPRDIALGLSTDGFGPFKRRRATAWPLILFNYNLPPEIRFHIDNIICLGVIPGPKKPVDMDSFLWPIVEELLRLQLGIQAFDVLADELFLLRAYLIIVFGDIPAVSMVMRMTGHNGFSPCRMCNIKGVRAPGNSRNNTYYVPLDRSRHPGVRAASDPVLRYDPAALPLRTEAEMLCQAKAVQEARSDSMGSRLARDYGIKGVPILSSIKSLLFPLSFPYDFMHLIWENLIPNLLLHWTGEFKGLDDGKEDYTIPQHVWQAIGVATADAGSTIPSAFGARPPNIVENKTARTAESWSFWALFLGPILLQRRFSKPQYYKHFIRLVKLLNICLQFEITPAEVEIVREGFIEWVKDYERYVLLRAAYATSHMSIGYTINTLRIAYPRALSQYMRYYT